MRNLMLLLSNFGSTILFVVLEIICFVLIINYNQQQKSIFAHSTNLFSGKVYSEKKKISDFLALRNVNDSLATEISVLKKRLLLLEGYGERKNIDSLANLKVKTARVINLSYKTFNNYITIDKGSDDGIKEGTGVIGDNGIIGVVTQTSNKYAIILSLLNSTSGISAKIKGENHFGVFRWEPGTDYFSFKLDAIPKHANLEIGDSILTSGYSTIFPPNLYIGQISHFEFKKGKSNYEIDVTTDVDLTNIEYVYIIENKDADEINKLENTIE